MCVYIYIYIYTHNKRNPLVEPARSLEGCNVFASSLVEAARSFSFSVEVEGRI